MGFGFMMLENRRKEFKELQLIGCGVTDRHQAFDHRANFFCVCSTPDNAAEEKR